MSSVEELSRKARFLRNAAPQQFSDFYGELAAYTERATDILVESTENFQLLQGHVQQLRNLLGVLEKVKNG
jgi:hypothetical protein